MSRFAGDAGIYLGANVLTAALSFALLPILTRVLTPADYGLVAMFTIMVNVFSALTGLCAQGALGVRFFEQTREHFARYTLAILAILAASSLSLVFLILAFADWIEPLTQLPRPWMVLVVCTAAAQIVVNIRLVLWQVNGQALRFGALQVAQSAANSTASLILVLAIGMGWQGRVVGFAAASVLFGLLSLYWLRRDVARPVERADLRDALSFGLPLIPHTLGALLIASADRMIIANVLDVSQAGIYTVALQLGLMLGLLTEAFNKAYAPWLMARLRQMDAALERRIVRGTYLYFLLLAGIAVTLGAAAPLLLSVIAGPEFQGAAPSVLFVALGFAFGGMYYMVTNYVFYASKTGRLALITLSSGAFNIVITWILVHALGAVGAALGFMCSQALLFLGTWWLAQRVRPMPWRSALFRVAA